MATYDDKFTFLRYECISDGSNKFWEVTKLSANTYSRKHGAIGTSGNSKGKNLNLNGVKEVIKQKLKKNYILTECLTDDVFIDTRSKKEEVLVDNKRKNFMNDISDLSRF